MKRKLLIALFTFGTIAGFGSGIGSMACWHGRAEARRAAFERHVADVCTDAALRTREGAPTDAPPPRAEYRDTRHGPRGYGW